MSGENAYGWWDRVLLAGIAGVVAFEIALALGGVTSWVTAALFALGVVAGAFLSALIEWIRRFAAWRGGTTMRRVDRILLVLLGVLVVVPLTAMWTDLLPASVIRPCVSIVLGWFAYQYLPDGGLKETLYRTAGRAFMRLLPAKVRSQLPPTEELST